MLRKPPTKMKGRSSRRENHLVPATSPAVEERRIETDGTSCASIARTTPAAPDRGPRGRRHEESSPAVTATTGDPQRRPKIPMIQYQKRRWTSHLLDVEGRCSARSSAGSRVCVALGGRGGGLDPSSLCRSLAVSPTVHTLVGRGAGAAAGLPDERLVRPVLGRPAAVGVDHQRVAEPRPRGLRSYVHRRRPTWPNRRASGPSAFAYAVDERPARERRASARSRDRLPAAETSRRSWRRRPRPPRPSPRGSPRPWSRRATAA